MSTCHVGEYKVPFVHMCIFQERKGPKHSSKSQKGCLPPKGTPAPPFGTMLAT